MLTLEQQRELQSRNAVLQRQLNASKRETKVQEEQLAEQEYRIEKLKREIAALKRKLFGGNQGEKVSDEQLALAEPEGEPLKQEISEKEVAGYTRHKNQDGDPKPRIPDHQEEVEEVIIPEEAKTEPDA